MIECLQDKLHAHSMQIVELQDTIESMCQDLIGIEDQTRAYFELEASKRLDEERRRGFLDAANFLAELKGFSQEQCQTVALKSFNKDWQDLNKTQIEEILKRLLAK